MTKTDTSSLEDRFQSLLDKGLSREKAERILNAEAADQGIIGEPEVYEDWSDEELFAHAGELGIEDRKGMSRDELIAAIRQN
jgi:hypothetical protein